MITDDFVKSMAVHAAYDLGSEDGVNAMLGVLFTIRNLARQYEGDWLRAILKLDVSGAGFPDVRDPNFLQVLQRVDGIFDESIPDTLTNGAVFCGSLFMAMERCAKIGNLIFYK